MTSQPIRKETKFAGAYVPEETHADLSAIAASEHRTLADHIRKLISDEIEKHKDLLATKKRKPARKSNK